jgi:hypothetical protein
MTIFTIITRVTLNVFACLIFLSAILATAQDTPKSIALTDRSDVPADNISKILRKECPNISIVKDATQSDFTLEAITGEISHGSGIEPEEKFTLTLFTPDGKTFHSTESTSLGSAVKTLCHAIKTSVLIEVVDTTNLTQSSDARGDTSGGAAAAIVKATTGRRTHTDTASIKVIVNGEHALLDCYEHRKGCGTIGPGKYFGEQDGDGIWINYQMPITHKPVRDHYKIAGSW